MRNRPSPKPERAYHGRNSRKTRYIPNVLNLVRKHFRFFLLAGLAGAALRLWFVFFQPNITSDTLIYGDIARNWLKYGVYAMTEGANITPTDMRLPGYPAVLAMFFAIFGSDHYRPLLLVQVIVDIGTCFVIADIAQRLFTARAAKIAFLLAALCPFLANYAAAALTETFEIFFTALALDFAVTCLRETDSVPLKTWALCGAAIAATILLRPDGGILLIAIELYLIFLGFFWLRARRSVVPLVKAAFLLGIVALAPLIPWTLRNMHTLHEFQPLAPRYANEESEFVPMGFNRWVKTWIAEYVSVEEVYWNVPDYEISTADLPSRAFDSPQQRKKTDDLFRDYDATEKITPALDARFAALAAQRIQNNPFRYYIWLPLVRIADMWLRPRTELLPADTRWWDFNDDPVWMVATVLLGLLNLLYVGAAVGGLVHLRITAPLGLMIAFVMVRSLFLGSLENPEPRYTLEMYPVVIVLAAALFVAKRGATRMTLETQELYAKGESVIRNRVRTCSDNSSMAPRFVTGSD